MRLIPALKGGDPTELGWYRCVCFKKAFAKCIRPNSEVAMCFAGDVFSADVLVGLSGPKGALYQTLRGVIKRPGVKGGLGVCCCKHIFK